MKKKLQWAGAVAALAILALAISCTGFFPKATLQTITLQPPTPSVSVGTTLAMQAWGTDSNSNRSQLTKNVSWELSNVSATNGGTVATIDPSSGLITGISPGTMTIQASSQGISGTTTATIVQIVNSMTITPSTGTITADGSSTASFQISGVVQVGNGTQNEDLTSAVTLTPEQNGTAVTGIVTCTFNSSTDHQDCTAATASVTTTQTYALVVTYGGYTGPQVSATLTVNP
jgi:trimeric autotransporter adhesin